MKFKDMPYKRVDMEAAKQELATIMQEFEAAKTAQEQLEVHKRYYALSERMQTQMTIASIRHSIDTSDEFYEAEKTYYDQEGPAFDNLAVQYKKMLYASPFREEIEKVIGGPAIRNIELASKAVSEEIIPLMQEENALVTEYEKLLASASIDWEGETLNLSTIIPYLNNKDRDIRRKAAAKANEFYKSIEEQLDELYDKLVKNRTQQAQKLGFETYTELGYCRMQRNSYWREEVERFRAQVKKDWVPFAEEMWENRRVRLGLDSMYHMDEGVSFPNGTPTPTGTPEEILKSGQEMYEELSPETKEFFDFMMDGDLFDVFSRPHKQVGGYMTYLPDYHAPFIFANFNGTAGDVDVVTHECGHAFQGYLAGKDPILEHADITMDTAETHSMSMEFFTNPWMEKFFGSRASDFLKSQLEDAVVFIPYGSMVDEFQHIVYDNPNLTPAQRKEAWKKLEAEYKPHMKYEEESSFFAEGGFWQRQHHIYSFPFYYIDYTLAQVCALEFYLDSLENRKDAWDRYVKLCKLGGSKSFLELIQAVDIHNPFVDGSIQNIVNRLLPVIEEIKL